MFEKQLQADLMAIFKVEKVTYQQPSEVKEQEYIFVDFEQPETRFRDKLVRCKVSGKATMFGNSDKLKSGYFAKCISQASKELHRKFHFSQIDANTKYYQNLVQRDFSFVYFYEGEYDPDTGLINEIDMTVIVTEG